MKKFIKLLLLFCMTIVVGSSIVSCNSEKIRNPFDATEQRQQDSTLIVRILKERTNPRFTDAGMFVTFRQTLLDTDRQDSVFKSVPTQMLRDIASLCVQKYGYIDKKLFLEEYDTFMNKDNKPIESYTALKPDANKADTTKPVEKHVTTDTIINGKHWQLVKEGETCVQ